MRRIALLFALLASPLVLAQEPPPPPDLQPVPDGSPSSDANPGENDLQPEVTIRRRQSGVVEEYRANGRIYMVRIVPRRGPAYYLIDYDGDGSLETRRNQFDGHIVAPGWVIHRW